MKKIIVILHGWSSTMTHDRYKELQLLLEEKGFIVYVPDLPGFGENKEMKKEALVFDDYVSFAHSYILDILKEKKVKNIILIGHSFGGRIAIRVTSLYPNLVGKLILTGASGIPRPLPSLKKKIIYITTKIARPIFTVPPFSFFYTIFRKLIYYSIGEMDYYKAGSLAKTFQNVYKVSIKDDLEKIQIPTLLVWGENDTIIPLEDGRYMTEHIKNSKMIVIPHATHRLPYENKDEFAKAVVNFS